MTSPTSKFNRTDVHSSASGSLTSTDRRYEPFVRPVSPECQRTTSEFRWRKWLIHLESVGNVEAPVRVLLIHGAGGNASAMWPFAAHIAGTGAVVTVVDLPGYGRTHPVKSAGISYRDWQELLVNLVDELHDPRPLILVGASLGGMLALDTAHHSEKVAQVIATCLLDLSDDAVRSQVLRAPWMGRTTSLLRCVKGPFRRVPVPLRWLTPMRRISNDPGLSTAVLADRRGGGSSMPLGWFAGVTRGPIVPAEQYAGAPVLLLHPGDDRWTPTEISLSYLERLPVSTRFVELPGAGHFPIEEPGFQMFLEQIEGVVGALADGVRRGGGTSA